LYLFGRQHTRWRIGSQQKQRFIPVVVMDERHAVGDKNEIVKPEKGLFFLGTSIAIPPPSFLQIINET
jgi:hypothetical protein